MPSYWHAGSYVHLYMVVVKRLKAQVTIAKLCSVKACGVTKTNA